MVKNYFKKKYVQVHFTFTLQFYVNVNENFFLYVFILLYDGENRYGEIFFQ